jgi:hypothetical protein
MISSFAVPGSTVMGRKSGREMALGNDGALNHEHWFVVPDVSVMGLFGRVGVADELIP